MDVVMNLLSENRAQGVLCRLINSEGAHLTRSGS